MRTSSSWVLLDWVATGRAVWKYPWETRSSALLIWAAAGRVLRMPRVRSWFRFFMALVLSDFGWYDRGPPFSKTRFPGERAKRPEIFSVRYCAAECTGFAPMGVSNTHGLCTI